MNNNLDTDAITAIIMGIVKSLRQEDQEENRALKTSLEWYKNQCEDLILRSSTLECLLEVKAPKIYNSWLKVDPLDYPKFMETLQNEIIKAHSKLEKVTKKS